MRTLVIMAVLCLPSQVHAIIGLADDSDERLRIEAELKKGQDAGNEIVTNLFLKNNAKPGQSTKVFDENIARYLKTMNEAYSKAIWMTIQAYEILPPGNRMEKGTICVGVNKGNPVIWLPQFDNHTDRVKTDETGQPTGTSSFMGDQGVSGTDGVSYIFPEAFTDPDFLAGTLFHEYVHFKQLTTPGRGDKMTHGQMELEAYSQQKAL